MPKQVSGALYKSIYVHQTLNLQLKKKASNDMDDARSIKFEQVASPFVIGKCHVISWLSGS